MSHLMPPNARLVAPNVCLVTPNVCWLAVNVCLAAPSVYMAALNVCWLRPNVCGVWPGVCWLSPNARTTLPKCLRKGKRRICLPKARQACLAAPRRQGCKWWMIECSSLESLFFCATSVKTFYEKKREDRKKSGGFGV
jgi:hypothetical protein